MEVRLNFIKKDPWSNQTKYPGCANQLGSYWTRSGVRYTGLTEEKARELEKKLGYQEYHLAPYSEFWITYAIRIPAGGITILTEVPTQELMYHFVKNHKRVADGTSKITPATDYVLTNQNTEAEEANKKNKVKRDAILEYGKMSITDMRKAMRLLGEKSDNISQDLVESKLFEMIEKDAKRFLDVWVNNDNKETDYVLAEALAKNIIRKNKNIYYYGTDIIGHSREDAIATLDDKANQDLRLVIMNSIQA